MLTRMHVACWLTVDQECTDLVIGNQDSYTWLTRCGFSLAAKAFTWACGLGNDCNNDNNFVLQLSNPTHIGITGLTDKADTVSAAAACSTGGDSAQSTQPGDSAGDASAKQCSESQGLSTGTVAAVGSGVGVPLLLLFVGALLATLWYRRKWLRVQRQHVASQPSYSRHSQYPMELGEKRGYPAQLDHVQSSVYEIGDGRQQ